MKRRFRVRHPAPSLFAFALHAGILLGVPSMVSAAAIGTGSLYLFDQKGGVGVVSAGATESLSLESLDVKRNVVWRDLAAAAGGWVGAGSQVLADGREELVIVRRTDAGVERVAAPPGDVRYRSWPVVFAAGEGSFGLAWLEGERIRELAVRSARWDGEAWRDLVTVAEAAAGTQTALAGDLLRDGRALLVWSAFDGSDDEILWSVGSGEEWSVPEPIHAPNDVPDVIPDVVATPAGAFAAWSRFDGNDYRMVVAEWRFGAWTEAGWSGGKGSLFPRFVDGVDRPIFLYRTTDPSSWNVVETRHGAGVVRETLFAIPADSRFAERPLVEWSDRPTLLWPASNAGGAGDRQPLEWRRETEVD